MSLDKYSHFKNKFDNTAPIRGRATEIKPIGQRRRDWETVVKVYVVEEGALDAEGVTAYGAHLYQTDCVVYLPNGDMYVKTGGWATPTTAEFISRHLPYSMRCYKKYNKVWVDYQSQAYPIDTTKPTIFRYNKDNDNYTVENPAPMMQKVIDRTKIKTARNKLEAFRTYAKMMLKLSDGWISNELVEEHSEKNEKHRDYWGRKAYNLNGQVFTGYEIEGSLGKNTAEKFYEALCTEDDTQFPKLLCAITQASNRLESRIIKQEQVEVKDYRGNPRMETLTTREYQYDYKTVDNRINYIIKQACDVHTTKEVPVGKIVTNLI
jgi:hypothetical protein